MVLSSCLSPRMELFASNLFCCAVQVAAVSRPPSYYHFTTVSPKQPPGNIDCCCCERVQESLFFSLIFQIVKLARVTDVFNSETAPGSTCKVLSEAVVQCGLAMQAEGEFQLEFFAGAAECSGGMQELLRSRHAVRTLN